jgi:hypothetical protein
MFTDLKSKFIFLFVGSLIVTSCSSTEIQSEPSEPTSITSTAEATVPREVEVKIQLDLGCEYVRKGFNFDGSEDQKIDSKVAFLVAADSFREVILDFQGAQQFMDGAIAASREVYRWANDSSLLSGARNQTYISEKDGNAIISIYNYCVATG